MLKIESIKLKKLLNRFRLHNVILLVVILFNLFLISRNSGFIFEKDIITTFGDQRLYFEASNNWFVNNTFYQSLYTIGYPLIFFLLTLLTQAKTWVDIMPSLIILQSLIVSPLIYYLILKYSKNNRVLQLLSLISYFILFGLFSSFTLNKYIFLGLLPLNEPFCILFLILIYILYKQYKLGVNKLRNIILISILISLIIWIRSVVIVLIFPVLIDLLLDKKFKDILKIIIITMLMYIPQIFVNKVFQGSFLFNGSIWWENLTEQIQFGHKLSIYGFVDKGLFTINYLLFNIKSLFLSYLPAILLIIVILKNKTNRLELLVIISGIIYLLLILSYWWSSADKLIDRFLLPLYFLLIFSLGSLKKINFNYNFNEK